jgi:hypothetical protein
MSLPQIPANAAVWIPPFDLDNITTIGYDKSTITPLNYTSPGLNDDFTFEFSLRPIFRVMGNVLNLPDGLYTEVLTDAPKLDISVSQVSNVNKDCEVAPAGTPSDQVFQNLTHVVPTLGYDPGFDITLPVTPVLRPRDDTTLPTSCLGLSSQVSATAPVSEPEPHSDGQRLRGGLAITSLAVAFMFAALL